MQDDERLSQLRRELSAADGSFLISLRTDLAWDKAAFNRLERAMRWACERYAGHDQLERWMAEGFYRTSHFVRDWTSHDHFPRPGPQHYYNECIERLDDLADWFFRGYHAYNEPHEWPAL